MQKRTLQLGIIAIIIAMSFNLSLLNPEAQAQEVFTGDGTYDIQQGDKVTLNNGATVEPIFYKEGDFNNVKFDVYDNIMTKIGTSGFTRVGWEPLIYTAGVYKMKLIVNSIGYSAGSGFSGNITFTTLSNNHYLGDGTYDINEGDRVTLNNGATVEPIFYKEGDFNNVKFDVYDNNMNKLGTSDFTRSGWPPLNYSVGNYRIQFKANTLGTMSGLGFGNITFTSIAGTTLTITNVAAETYYVAASGQYNAYISWSTNNLADGKLRFCGTSICTNPQIVTGNSNVTYHQISVPGALNANTKYYYKVVSKDSFGDEVEYPAGSSWLDFTTPGQQNPPANYNGDGTYDIKEGDQIKLTNGAIVKPIFSQEGDFFNVKFDVYDGSMTKIGTSDSTRVGWEPLNYYVGSYKIQFKVNSLGTISGSYLGNITFTSISGTQPEQPNLVLSDPAPAGPLPIGVEIGQLVKLANSSTIYFIDQDNRRHAFPDLNTYSSWFPSFNNVQVISPATLANIPLGSNILMRPGTFLIKITSLPYVYAVEPYGVIRWIKTEEIVKTLYGNDWGKRVVDVSDAFFTNYQVGSDISTAVHPTGNLIQYTGGSTTYYIENGTKRNVDGGVYLSNLYQSRFLIQNVSTSLAYTDGSSMAALPIEDLMKLR